MPEESVIEKADTPKDIMEHPKVKDAIVKVLERKLREPLPPKIARGWEKVRKGTKCVFPDCEKKATTACFHGYPLCEYHMHLAQWVSIIIYDCVYDDENPDNLGPRVDAIEIWHKNIEE